MCTEVQKASGSFSITLPYSFKVLPLPGPAAHTFCLCWQATSSNNPVSTCPSFAVTGMHWNTPACYVGPGFWTQVPQLPSKQSYPLGNISSFSITIFEYFHPLSLFLCFCDFCHDITNDYHYCCPISHAPRLRLFILSLFCMLLRLCTFY